jgi:O-methyltransferase involved in polyketide biosynthesis
MDGVNKTLYIPLYGKAYVSRAGVILEDPMAERLWEAEGFPLKGKSRSKWLAYYMGMRSAVFDDWVRQQMAAMDGAVVLHIGCGMDSRCRRVGTQGHLWFDIDFAEIIEHCALTNIMGIGL